MKTRIIYVGALLLIIWGLMGCNDDYENSSNPQERIIGKWKVIKDGTFDTQGTVHSFSKEGKWNFKMFVADEIETEPVLKDISMDIFFEDDWVEVDKSSSVLDGETNVIGGHFFTREKSHDWSGIVRYACQIGTRKMMIVAEYPEGWILCRDPRIFLERQ